MSNQTDELSSATLNRVTRELLENDSELRCEPIFHRDIVERIAARQGELSKVLRAEIQGARDARRGWRRPWTFAALAEFLLSVAYLVWIIFWGAGISFHSSPGPSTLSLSLVILGTVGIARRWIVLRRGIRETAARVQDELRPQLHALILFMISELQSDETRWSNTLQTTRAPSLVELNLDDTISSASYERLRAFIEGHESSAIGLAGPRGSGKTTLMRQLERDDALDCHVAVVSAPVRYSATEFTRLVHEELARAGLAPGEAGRIRDRAVVRAAKAVLAAVVFVLLLALWVFDKDRPHLRLFAVGWFGATALVVGLLILGFLLSRAWSLFQGRARLMAMPRTVPELCRQQLDFLRWSATLEASAKTSFKLAGSGLEGVNRLSRTERELTHTDAVQALKGFIRRLVALSHRSVIICVDELDKLADPDEAVEAINGIKDLFHLRHGHFVLSVSTDAMHSFAARGVPVRDVFDSAFDTIIPVSPLTFEESRTLIARRARDFSAAAALFCHAWSGGHARDLIRTSRSCVAFRQALKEDEKVTVATLAKRVLHSDLCEVVDATIEKLRGEDDSAAAAMLYQVLAFQEALEADDVALHKVIEATSFPDGARTFSSEAQRLAVTLAPYARIAGMCERLFSDQRSPAEWQSEAVSEAVAALAEARRSLGRHPREIDRRLRRAADACAVVAASG